MTRSPFGRRLAPALLATLFLPACAVFQKQVPLTPEQAYERGTAAYQARRYGRAAELLKRWVDANPGGDPRMPAALLALARSHLETGDYVTAGSGFLRVVSDFPQSPEQTPARFGICDAYHRMSPRPQLDQQYTEAAITYCQSYAEYYPDTPEAGQARRWVAEMREKLAYKNYLNGLFYLRRQAYDAAVIYFNDAANDFPDTRWAPAALAKVVEAYGKIGYREEAEEARQRLLRDFPQSPEARALAAAPAAGSSTTP